MVDSLAAELNVSRQPVLYAMRQLANQQLVEVIPQVGCRVANPNIEEMGDFFLIFSTVEGLIAQLAAERHKEMDLHRLHIISEQINGLKKDGIKEDSRSEGYRIFNREFHGVIHQMACASEMIALAQSYWDRSDFYMTCASSRRMFSERLLEAHDEHELLIEAIAARNVTQAFELMRSHISAFWRDLSGFLAP